MEDLRQGLIRLAHENPELRKHLLPILRESAEGKAAGWKDVLEKLWKGYKKEHPNSTKPPQSLVDKAKSEAGGEEPKKEEPKKEEPKKEEPKKEEPKKEEPKKDPKEEAEDEDKKEHARFKAQHTSWRAVYKKDLEDAEKELKGFQDSLEKNPPKDPKQLNNAIQRKKDQVADIKKKYDDLGADSDEYAKAQMKKKKNRTPEEKKKDDQEEDNRVNRMWYNDERGHSKYAGLSLRQGLIRLAYENPELRKHLLPLLRG